MEKNCYFNKESETYIYHFTKETLIDTNKTINMTNNKKIHYEKMYDVGFDKNMENIINKCKNNNILIIVDSFENTKILEEINKYTEKLKNKSYVLQNITIINYTNNNKNVLYYVKNECGEDMFKKIINVFPTHGDLFANDENFFKNIKLNVNIPTVVDINKNLLYTFRQKGGEIKNIVIRVMDTKEISKNLKEQWWFLWYFSIPSCANIRLLQSTGTCWVNSAINLLFMSEKILNIIKAKYEDKNEYKIKFADFEKNKNSKILCNSLVYNLIINKTKAKHSDGNFLAYLASLLKCEYKGESKKCKNAKYGDGGDAYEALKLILKYIIGDDNFTHVDIYKLVMRYDEYDEIYKKYTEKYNEYTETYKEYEKNEKNKQHYDEHQVKYLRDKFNNLNEQLKIYVEKLNNINNEIKNVTIKNYILDKNKIFKEYSTNKILIFSGDFDKNIKDNILFNDKKYKLCASIIQLNFGNQTHVVSGIICNKIYYIYDSNNILLQCDWNKGGENIKKTLEDKKMKSMYGEIKFDQIYVLLYILDF